MAERNPPVWMQSGTYNAVDDRMVTSLLTDRTITVDGNSYGIEGGVVPPLNQLQVTAAGGMALAVSPGMIIIRSSGTNPPGAYLCYNDGATSLSPVIESSANPRIDFIYAEAEDIASGGTTSVWRLAIKKGTASANPTYPTLTANQYPLAAVRVIPAASNGGLNKIDQTNITDFRTFAAGPGGVHLKWGAGLNPANSPGRLLYAVSEQNLYVNTGATWDRVMTYGGFFGDQTARAVHASQTGGIRNSIAHASLLKTWQPYMFASGSTQAAGAQNVVWATSRSGQFEVTFSMLARLNPLINAADINGTTLVQSIEVANASGTVLFGPNSGWAAGQARTPNWETVSTTILVPGMPANESLRFRTMWWYTTPAGKTTASEVNSQYIFVNPIL